MSNRECRVVPVILVQAIVSNYFSNVDVENDREVIIDNDIYMIHSFLFCFFFFLSLLRLVVRSKVLRYEQLNLRAISGMRLKRPLS